LFGGFDCFTPLELEAFFLLLLLLGLLLLLLLLWLLSSLAAGGSASTVALADCGVTLLPGRSAVSCIAVEGTTRYTALLAAAGLTSSTWQDTPDCSSGIKPAAKQTRSVGSAISVWSQN
jgi:hypothetical protein